MWIVRGVHPLALGVLARKEDGAGAAAARGSVWARGGRVVPRGWQLTIEPENICASASGVPRLSGTAA